MPPLLRSHFQESREENEDAGMAHPSDGRRTTYLNPFSRFIAALSKLPLLMRAPPGLGTGSYGAAPVGMSTDNSEEEDINDVRRRMRRKQKDSGFGKSSVRAVGDHHGDPQTVGQAAVHGVSHCVPPLPNLDGNTGLEARYGARGLPVSAEATLEQSNTGKEASHASEGSDRSSGEAVTTADDVTSDDEDPPDNSPNPQVRASISAVDDTTLSINTPRI